jgi:hypothetical protein
LRLGIADADDPYFNPSIKSRQTKPKIGYKGLKAKLKAKLSEEADRLAKAKRQKAEREGKHIEIKRIGTAVTATTAADADAVDEEDICDYYGGNTSKQWLLANPDMMSIY